LAILLFGCAHREGRPIGERALWTSSRQSVSDDVTHVAFRLFTGSCWGTDVHSSDVLVLPAQVLVRGGDNAIWVSRAFWQRARERLNAGIQASTAPDSSRVGELRCPGAANFYCRFSVRLDGGAPIEGCCTSTPARKAFDDLRAMTRDEGLHGGQPGPEKR